MSQAKYRKTAKGIDEIERRNCGLTGKLRRALIQVDGNKTEVDLSDTFTKQGFDKNTLNLLVDQGFVEVVKSRPKTAIEDKPSGSRSRFEIAVPPGFPPSPINAIPLRNTNFVVVAVCINDAWKFDPKGDLVIKAGDKIAAMATLSGCKEIETALANLISTPIS